MFETRAFGALLTMREVILPFALSPFAQFDPGQSGE